MTEKYYTYYDSIFDILDGDDKVRANMFYSTILHKQRAYKSIFKEDYIGNYISCSDLRDILGRHKYKKILEMLINTGVITLLDKKNSYGQQLYFIHEVKEINGVKKVTTSRRVVRSIHNNKKRKYENLSKEAKQLLKNLQKTKIKISKEEYNKITETRFQEYVSSCNTIGGHLTFEEYSQTMEYVWNLIQRFNESETDDELLDFISEDNFGHRIHSLISLVPSILRKFIEIDGEETTEVDLKASQPTILAKVLKNSIGENDFTTAVTEKEDIYIDIQEKLHLPNRSSAKTAMFEMMFGSTIGNGQRIFDTFFPQAGRVVRQIKSKKNIYNPSDKIYSYLAFLMQLTERKIFGEIWNELVKQNIVYLTVHDSIICKKSELSKVITIMEQVLSKHIDNFKIVSK